MSDFINADVDIGKFNVLPPLVKSPYKTIQVLPPSGADFATDAPNMVQSIVRAAVGQTGNTPVESGAEIQLRTTLMTMGSSIVVVCEQVKDGAVVGTGKQKAPSVDDLDVAIENAAKQALANVEVLPPLVKSPYKTGVVAKRNNLVEFGLGAAVHIKYPAGFREELRQHVAERGYHFRERTVLENVLAERGPGFEREKDGRLFVLPPLVKSPYKTKIKRLPKI